MSVELRRQVMDLQARIVALTQLERRAREAEAVAERRAVAAEEAARRAWQLGAWPARRAGH